MNDSVPEPDDGRSGNLRHEMRLFSREPGGGFSFNHQLPKHCVLQNGCLAKSVK